MIASLPRADSLLGRTLVRVALRISLIVVIASAASYWHVRSGLEAQALMQLQTYVAQRRARESEVFELAAADLDIFAGAYQKALAALDPATASARFRELFTALPDGTTRLREQVFAEHGVTGFIGRHVPITPDLEQRLVAALDLLAQFGPAWRNRFADLFVTTPENALLVYWPDQPWALQASEWEINGKLALVAGSGSGVRVVTGGPAPAEAERRWSDLYFDYGVNQWMVSGLRAVNRDGRLLLSVGHDILLDDLIGRTLSGDLPGTFNLLFRRDGRLIAHQRYMEAIQARGGMLEIAETGDRQLERLQELAAAHPGEGVVIDDLQDGNVAAITELSGPGWLLATVFPRALVADQAFRTARIVLLLGLLALLLELGVLSAVLRSQVALPLRRLMHAARQVASGRLQARLDTERPDEIGELARAFTDMAGVIDARETTLSDRSRNLAEVNERLQAELEERTRREVELAQQRELTALLNVIDYGILFLDRELRTRLANRAYREMWGIPEPLTVGRVHVADLIAYNRGRGVYDVPDEAWDGYLAARVAAIARGAVPSQEIRRADGRIVLHACVELPDGGRMLTYFDITELKRREAALIEANRAKDAALADRQALVDGIDYGVLFLDAELRVRLANRAYRELWSIGEESQILGCSLRDDMELCRGKDLYPVAAEAWEAYVAERIAAVRAGAIEPCELRLTNGKVLRYQCVALPDGGRMLTYYDLTELKRAEETLRRHLAAMEAAMDGMAMVDPAGTYIYLNVAHARVYGYDSPDEILGRSWRAFYPPDEVARFEASILPALAVDGRWHGEAMGRRRDGSLFPQEVSLTAVAGVGIICVVRDITSRKAREAALRESEEFNRRIVESSPVCIKVLDLEGHVLSINGPGLRLLEIDRVEDVAGQPWPSFWPEELQAAAGESLAAARAGDTSRLQGWCRTARGSVKWFEVFITPVPDAAGRPHRLLVVSHDITEEHLAAGALAASQAQLERAQGIAHVGHWCWEVAEDRVFNVSAELARVFAVPLQDFPPDSATYLRFIHPDDRDRMLGLWERVAHEGLTEYHVEYRIVRADGDVRTLDERAETMRLGPGGAVEMLGTVQDITERKHAESELQEAMRRAEAANRAKSRFLASMSHELRTPMNAIIGFTRIVMRRSKDVLPEQQYTNLEKILGSANHLLALINDVLDLSKIEAGRMELRLSQIDLRALIEQCLRTVEPLVRPGRVRLRHEIDPALPLVVADQDKLRQILLNLLGNAAKFTEAGSIFVAARRVGAAGLEITVSDTGIGIPEAALGRIFAEFTQVDGHAHGGTGLGLPISQSLARLMGGEITVASTPGAGSTFTLTLPLQSPLASPHPRQARLPASLGPAA